MIFIDSFDDQLNHILQFFVVDLLFGNFIFGYLIQIITVLFKIFKLQLSLKDCIIDFHGLNLDLLLPFPYLLVLDRILKRHFDPVEHALPRMHDCFLEESAFPSLK